MGFLKARTIFTTATPYIFMGSQFVRIPRLCFYTYDHSETGVGSRMVFGCYN